MKRARNWLQSACVVNTAYGEAEEHVFVASRQAGIKASFRARLFDSLVSQRKLKRLSQSLAELQAYFGSEQPFAIGNFSLAYFHFPFGDRDTSGTTTTQFQRQHPSYIDIVIRADDILRNSNINFGVRAQTRLLNHCASSVNLLSR